MATEAPSRAPMPGATYLGAGRCEFVVWAPLSAELKVCLAGAGAERVVPLSGSDNGYYHGILDGVDPGTNFWYQTNSTTRRPDPASRFQPQGVHGPSQVVAREFPWEDAAWPGVELADCIFYEIHVGTFTSEGTLDAIVPFLPELRSLGITAVELMPLAQFSG